MARSHAKRRLLPPSLALPRVTFTRPCPGRKAAGAGQLASATPGMGFGEWEAEETEMELQSLDDVGMSLYT